MSEPCYEPTHANMLVISKEEIAAHGGLVGLPYMLYSTAVSSHLAGKWTCWAQAAANAPLEEAADPRARWNAICARVKASSVGKAATAAIAALATTHALDDLIVYAVAMLDSELISAWRASPYALQYAAMQKFAFNRPPARRDDFDFLRPLGRGGYGMVYAVQKRDTGKLYAMKCMDKRLVKSRHATRMIMAERDVLASVDHPFVSGLQYAFHDEKEVFFALELKTGGDLEYYLLHLGRRFKEDEVRFFAAEILLGLKVRLHTCCLHVLSRSLTPPSPCSTSTSMGSCTGT